MSQPLASLSAGLVGRRRPNRARPLVFVPPTPATKSQAPIKPVPLIGPSLRTEVPNVMKKTTGKSRVAKTLRISPDLNGNLLTVAEAKGCSQQSIMESALRTALDAPAPRQKASLKVAP